MELYVVFGVTQAADAYTTVRALQHGGRETNPILPPVTSHVIAASVVKAASAATTIYFAERLWRRHRTAAVIVMAGIDGISAAIALHNTSIARRGRR